MSRPRLSVIALVLALCLCTLPARAEARALTVGVEDLTFAPYGTSRDGDYQGFARDLLDAFAAQYGHELQYVPLPIKRLYQEFLETRVVDLKFPDSSEWHPSKRKGLEIFYSEPVCRYTDGIMVRPEHLGQGMERIKILGILAGFKPWLLKPAMSPKKLTVSENASLSGLLGKALLGRVDAIYVNREAADHLLRQMGLRDRLVLDPDLPFKIGDYRLSTINSPDVMREFNEFLKRRADVVNALKRKHGLLP